jgi:hypothetical protein
MSLFEQLSPRKRRDARVLGNFVGIYCRERHKDAAKEPFLIQDEELAARLASLRLCPDCARLLTHGLAKLSQCPYEPKPSCRHCKTHCYAPGYRENMRGVMRFSGIYLVRHGRLDLLLHLLF